MRKSIAAIISLLGVIALFILYGMQMPKLGKEITRLKERMAVLEEQQKEQPKTTEPAKTIKVYFTEEDRVVAVERPAPKAQTQKEELEAAFAALLAGPSQEESERGFSTQLPKETRLLSVEVKEGIAHLNFSQELEKVAGSARIRGILKQIGYTATGVEGIRGAWLLIEGKKIDVFGAEGALIEKPLARSEGPEL